MKINISWEVGRNKFELKCNNSLCGRNVEPFFSDQREVLNLCRNREQRLDFRIFCVCKFHEKSGKTQWKIVSTLCPKSSIEIFMEIFYKNSLQSCFFTVSSFSLQYHHKKSTISSAFSTNLESTQARRATRFSIHFENKVNNFIDFPWERSGETRGLLHLQEVRSSI